MEEVARLELGSAMAAVAATAEAMRCDGLDRDRAAKEALRRLRSQLTPLEGGEGVAVGECDGYGGGEAVPHVAVAAAGMAHAALHALTSAAGSGGAAEGKRAAVLGGSRAREACTATVGRRRAEGEGAEGGGAAEGKGAAKGSEQAEEGWVAHGVPGGFDAPLAFSAASACVAMRRPLYTLQHSPRPLCASLHIVTLPLYDTLYAQASPSPRTIQSRRRTARGRQ